MRKRLRQTEMDYHAAVYNRKAAPSTATWHVLMKNSKPRRRQIKINRICSVVNSFPLQPSSMNRASFPPLPRESRDAESGGRRQITNSVGLVIDVSVVASGYNGPRWMLNRIISMFQLRFIQFTSRVCWFVNRRQAGCRAGVRMMIDILSPSIYLL